MSAASEFYPRWCFYCRTPHESPLALRAHVAHAHPDSFRENRYRKEKGAEPIDRRTTDMNLPNDASEEAVTKSTRKNKRRVWIGNIKIVVLVLLLSASSAGIGWGWGYNTRVSQECSGVGGNWAAHTQICQGPKGPLKLQLGTTSNSGRITGMDTTENTPEFLSTDPKGWALQVGLYLKTVASVDAVDLDVIERKFAAAIEAGRADQTTTALKPLSEYQYGDFVEVYDLGLWVPARVAESDQATGLVSVDTERGPKTIQSTRSIRPHA